MVRFALAGFAMLALAGAAAAEEDNGPALVDLFAKTCALRPALPSEIERIASGVGFVSEGSAISAAMESRPQIDILYSARLTKRGEKVSLTAYFAGPVDAPTVSCGLNTIGVSAEALPGLIETSLNAHDRTEKTPADNKRLRASWRVGAAEGGDTLEVSAWRDSPRRASISFMYRSRKQ
ncbi:hypothetical protein V1291_004382 [Nitrobacteraceae bacterium AZCC 1564]